MKNTKIQKITSRGQITLPISWRKKFKADAIALNTKDDSITISPVVLSDSKKEKEYTVFDAIRDNKGKGIKASDLIKILKKINE